MFILITYDVVEKRTEKFRSLLCKYLVHEQNSVFSGILKASELDILQSELSRISIPGDKLFLLVASNRHNVSVERLEAGEKGFRRSERMLDSNASSVVL